MRETKFYFLPYVGKKKIKRDSAYAKINRPGIVHINENSCHEIGIPLGGPVALQLFFDAEKRTFGFRHLEKIVMSGDKSIKVIKPIILKNGSRFLQFSIKPFLNAIGFVSYPMPRLHLKEFTDKGISVKLWYFIVPKLGNRAMPETE